MKGDEKASLIKLAKNETNKKLTTSAKKCHRPERRHTIALSTIELSTNHNDYDDSDFFNENSHDYDALSNILSQMEENRDKQLNLEAHRQIQHQSAFNEFNFLTNQELREQLVAKSSTCTQENDRFMEYIDKSQPKLFRHSIKKVLPSTALSCQNNEPIKRPVNAHRRHTIQDPKLVTSKSIANLPSLTNKIEAQNSALKPTLMKKKQEHAEHQVKTTILNLSPLSISASSVTTGGTHSSTANSASSSASSASSSNSASINSLIHSTSRSKLKLDQVATKLASVVGSITKTAVNTIATDSSSKLASEANETTPPNSNSNLTETGSPKFHSSFMKQQNVQFNCTFESLI